MKAIRRFSVRPVYPESLRPLHDLAHNLRWSWQPETRELLKSTDPDGWAATGGDPVRTLAAVTPERLAELDADPAFRRRVARAAAELNDYLTEPRWYQQQGNELPRCVAYFSPEFGITPVLPQYSGGLGILAGDHLKAVSDLGVPLIGVGLLYRHGYFCQRLSADGWQQEQYPALDPETLPAHLLTERDGSPVRISLALPDGAALTARVRQLAVGRVPLLLLETDPNTGDPVEHDVTDRLYGGDSQHRLRQEMLLGIGGMRAVRAFCRRTGHPEPEVFHMNEGHAGLLGPERIRELTEAGAGFDAALRAVRAGTVFTTHTPVPAGIDRFPRELVARHFGPNAELPELALDRLLALGQEPGPGADATAGAAAVLEGDHSAAPADSGDEPSNSAHHGPGAAEAQFNMAYLGLRTAQRANGVSALHGAVSREMFAALWPGFDPEEVPITSVTNGVHTASWTADALHPARHPGAVPPGPTGRPARAVEQSDAELWQLRRNLREDLVTEVRSRLRASWRQRGAGSAELDWIDRVFDPDVLTLGFARRVPSYKRLTLMLRDPDRLQRLLLHPEQPVQIVVAGKAHPADDGGKQLIQDLVRFADDPAVRHRIVFLPDYGMAMAATLYTGCDVWLNNPLRPMEACGTSGMKSALNGGLNLSVRDGWWDEWYDPDTGWEIPTADGCAGSDPERRDAQEAAALYRLLEEAVVPCFYAAARQLTAGEAAGAAAAGQPKPGGGLDRSESPRWLAMVRATIERLTPLVHAERMVKQYVRTLYTPAAAAHRSLAGAAATAPDGPAQQLAEYATRVGAAWPQVAVVAVDTGSPQDPDTGDTPGSPAPSERWDGEEPAGAAVDESPAQGRTVPLQVRVTLGDLQPGDIEVQAVAGRVDVEGRITDAVTVPLKPSGSGPDLTGCWTYTGELVLDRAGPFGCTARVLPTHPLLASQAELGLVALPGPELQAADTPE